MSTDQQPASQQTSIAFLGYREFDDGAAYRGAILVTDEWSKPLEFRCTAPVRPTDLQRTLYGKSMLPHILTELIGAPLISSVREPDKLETYHKLTAAINLAKDSGDIELLREIAEDPHGFILRQGWAKLDFGDREELTQLRRLHETLLAEIKAVAKSLEQLRASPDYELCQLAEQKPGVLDELAAERVKQLELENAELEQQAERLADR